MNAPATTPASWIASFVFGFSMPLRAARILIASPKLLAWAALPLALTFGVYAAFFITLFNWVSQAVPVWITSLGFTPQGWMLFLIQSITVGLALLTTALSFSAVASVVASPLNDFLSEASEPYVYPPLPPAPKNSFARTARLLAIDIAKNIAALFLTLCALALSWVPVLNVLAVGVAILLLTFQYVSYPQTRRGETLGDGFRFLRRHFFACLGFGSAHLLLFAIPGISALFVPIAVVGGTALVARAKEGSIR